MKVYIVHGSVGDAYDYTTWIHSVHISAEAAMWYMREMDTHYSKEYPRLVKLNELARTRYLTDDEETELRTLELRWYWHTDNANYWIEEYEVLG